VPLRRRSASATRQLAGDRRPLDADPTDRPRGDLGAHLVIRPAVGHQLVAAQRLGRELLDVGRHGGEPIGLEHARQRVASAGVLGVEHRV
jgi:hypothetical protein